MTTSENDSSEPVALNIEHEEPSIFDGTVTPRLVERLQRLIDDYGHAGVTEVLVQMTDGALLSYMDTDAQRWAAQYMRLHGGELPDEGNLIGWFANAIEAGSERWR